MKKIKIKDLVLYASVAAIYVVLTVVLGSFSFGPIQFRIAEALVLLCFFEKKFFLPLTIGCLISNVMSPYAVMDMIFGTFATIISLLCIIKSKNIFVASLFPVIFNALIVGLEISILTPPFNIATFLFFALTVGIGEFVCVSLIGVGLFSILRKNESFMNLIISD